MKRTRSLAVATSGAALALMLAAVGPVASSASAAPRIRYGGNLHIVMPWGSIDDNFNPLNPGGTGSTAGGTLSMLYEPLIYVNNYTGALTDMLATSYAWSNGNRTLTIVTRQGVKWSDGKPFSAADVAYTFNLIKANKALDVNGLFTSEDLQSVTATNSNTVVFKFSSPYTTSFEQIFGQLIVPKHIWSHISDPVTFANTHPVGSGPFELSSYTSTQVSYKKNPNYWMQGRPYLSGVTMTAVKSNDSAELLVLNGDAAWTYDAITDAPKTFVAAHPYDKIYWPAISLNLMYMNDTSQYFSDPVLRKAIAEAINTTTVADRAYFGALGPASEEDISSGQVSQWVPKSIQSLAYKYNPAAALALLKANGYSLNSSNQLTKGGTVLPTFKILTGAGWSDFLSISQTFSEELQAIGISTTIDQEPWTTYYPSLQDGNYDFALSWSNGGGPSPYYIYYDLASKAESANTGSTANTNWERYYPTAVQSALSQYNATSSASTQAADMQTIEKAVLADVPVIPLTGRANWMDYSTKYFSGWPSYSDPYSAGEAPDGGGIPYGGAEQVYLNVHLNS